MDRATRAVPAQTQIQEITHDMQILFCKADMLANIQCTGKLRQDVARRGHVLRHQALGLPHIYRTHFHFDLDAWHHDRVNAHEMRTAAVLLSHTGVERMERCQFGRIILLPWHLSDICSDWENETSWCS